MIEFECTKCGYKWTATGYAIKCPHCQSSYIVKK